MKKFVISCFLAAGLAFAFPSFSSVSGVSTLAVSAADLDASAPAASVLSGWQQDANGRYYLQNGVRLTGVQELDEDKYYFDASGYLSVGGWINDNGDYYYAGSNGILKTGFQKINGNRYYFDETTCKRASGVTEIGDYTYCFRKNGLMRTGVVKQSKGTIVHFYDSDGRRVSGWFTYKGKKYYFDPKNDDTRVQNCWKKIKKKYYHFSATGIMQTGFFTVDGQRCYTNANGVLVKGWQTINGRKYYIDPDTFTIRTGWLKYNSKKYYLNPNTSASTYGAATTGFVSIPTKKGTKKYWYYFNDDGSMYTGWLAQNGNRYYFKDSNGRMLTGKQRIAGKDYTFSKTGILESDEPTGPWRIEVNRKGCFVVVYRGDTPVRAFVCSTAADGVSTPLGNFTIMDHLRWHELNGPSWGQFCSHVTPDILFHSVPNYQRDNHTLESAQYNLLGRPASGGCIRLTVKHAKYIYDNVPIGARVTISDTIARPAGVVIETAPKIPLSQNYDPTDPYA